MYATLLFLHSIFRWFVVCAIAYAVLRAARGYFLKKEFTNLDNGVRHWTATIAHLQLVIGIFLYIKSPIIHYFFSSFKHAFFDLNVSFFGVYHALSMFIAILVITIGSAKAKRKKTDLEKFQTMLWWFGIAFIVILIAIPWPFSIFPNRPYLRFF